MEKPKLDRQSEVEKALLSGYINQLDQLIPENSIWKN